MEQIDSTPTQTPQSHVEPIPVSPPPAEKTKSGGKMLYVLLLIILLSGFLAAFVLLFGNNSKNNQQIPQSHKTRGQEKVTLPSDVVKIQSCAAHKGVLYVKPQNIPVGPVFMVDKGEVIGIEYMLSKSDFLSGKSFGFLEGLGMKVNHVNIGLLSTGHEGYADPHYHVDMYTVSKVVEQAITCPAPATPTTNPSESAVTPTATLQPTITTPASSPSAGQ